MTVQNSNRRNDYVGNGSTATYGYTFRIFDEDDLLVTERDTADAETRLVKTTDYTVAGVGDKDGGTITLVAGNLTLNHNLTIRRVLSLVQNTDLRNQGAYLPENVEDQFDKLIMVDQQQQDEIDRSVKLPETVAGTFGDLPAPSANKLLGVNATGDGWALFTSADTGVLAVSTFMETVLDDTSAPDALTTLGIGTGDSPTWAGATLTSTDAGATAGPTLDLYRNSASPAAADNLAELLFSGENDADEKVSYAGIIAQVDDPTDGSEDATLKLQTMVGGTLTTIADLSSGEALFSLNEVELYHDDGNAYFRAHTDQANGVAGIICQNDERSWIVRVNGGGSDRFEVRDDTSGSNHLTISTDGELNLPQQPCFNVTNTSTQNNVTGNGTSYQVQWPNEIIDQGGNFASSVFTAPITGRYLLTTYVYATGFTSAADQIRLSIVTSNRTYRARKFKTNDVFPIALSIAVVADMDAGDTAQVNYFVDGEASDVVDIQSSPDSFFTGALLN